MRGSPLTRELMPWLAGDPDHPGDVGRVHLDLVSHLGEELRRVARVDDGEEVGLGEVAVGVHGAGRDVGDAARFSTWASPSTVTSSSPVEDDVDLLPRVAVRGRPGRRRAAGVEDLDRRPHGVGEQRAQRLPQHELVVARFEGIGGPSHWGSVRESFEDSSFQ